MGKKGKVVKRGAFLMKRIRCNLKNLKSAVHEFKNLPQTKESDVRKLVNVTKDAKQAINEVIKAKRNGDSEPNIILKLKRGQSHSDRYVMNKDSETSNENKSQKDVHKEHSKKSVKKPSAKNSSTKSTSSKSSSSSKDSKKADHKQKSSRAHFRHEDIGYISMQPLDERRRLSTDDIRQLLEKSKDKSQSAGDPKRGKDKKENNRKDKESDKHKEKDRHSSTSSSSKSKSCRSKDNSSTKNDQTSRSPSKPHATNINKDPYIKLMQMDTKTVTEATKNDSHYSDSDTSSRHSGNSTETILLGSTSTERANLELANIHQTEATDMTMFEPARSMFPADLCNISQSTPSNTVRSAIQTINSSVNKDILNASNSVLADSVKNVSNILTGHAYTVPENKDNESTPKEAQITQTYRIPKLNKNCVVYIHQNPANSSSINNVSQNLKSGGPMTEVNKTNTVPFLCQNSTFNILSNSVAANLNAAQNEISRMNFLSNQNNTAVDLSVRTGTSNVLSNSIVAQNGITGNRQISQMNLLNNQISTAADLSVRTATSNVLSNSVAAKQSAPQHGMTDNRQISQIHLFNNPRNTASDLLVSEELEIIKLTSVPVQPVQDRTAESNNIEINNENIVVYAPADNDSILMPPPLTTRNTTLTSLQNKNIEEINSSNLTGGAQTWVLLSNQDIGQNPVQETPPVPNRIIRRRSTVTGSTEETIADLSAIPKATECIVAAKYDMETELVQIALPTLPRGICVRLVNNNQSQKIHFSRTDNWQHHHQNSSQTNVNIVPETSAGQNSVNCEPNIQNLSTQNENFAGPRPAQISRRRQTTAGQTCDSQQVSPQNLNDNYTPQRMPGRRVTFTEEIPDRNVETTNIPDEQLNIQINSTPNNKVSSTSIRPNLNSGQYPMQQPHLQSNCQNLTNNDQVYMTGQIIGNPQPEYIQQNENVSAQPGCILQNLNVSAQPACIQQNQNVSAQPGYIQQHQNVSAQPGYIQQNLNVSAQPGYIQQYENVSAQPGYIQQNENVSAQTFVPGHQCGYNSQNGNGCTSTPNLQGLMTCNTPAHQHTQGQDRSNSYNHGPVNNWNMQHISPNLNQTSIPVPNFPGNNVRNYNQNVIQQPYLEQDQQRSYQRPFTRAYRCEPPYQRYRGRNFAVRYNSRYGDY